MYMDEYIAVSRAWADEREREMRDGWERMRLLATLCVQPHVRKSVTPEKLLKFPWDDKKAKKPIPSREEAMKEYHALMERLNQKENGKE